MLLDNNNSEINTKNDNKKLGSKFARFAPWIVLISLALFAFGMSAIPGASSDAMSRTLVDFLLHRLDHIINMIKNEPDWVLYLYLDSVIRSFAHFIIFFFMLILLVFAYKTFIKNKHLTILCAYGTTFIFACLDEFHQSFVAGRTSSTGDIITDMIGSSLAVILIFAVLILKRVIKWLALGWKTTSKKHN